jgi:serine/threonine protein kinase
MQMTAEEWQEVKKVLAIALEREPGERAGYLDRNCANPSLRREVDSLIVAYERSDRNFMEQSPVESGVLKAGTMLGSYEILGPLGQGGMGKVYKARDTRLDRIVAIKVLRADLADCPEVRERFVREARTIASLNHPHICTLYDIGNQDGADFLVMEYLEGETLAGRLERGSLPLELVVQYTTEIADALDKAYSKGVTHRDLKPSNIVLTSTGSKLLDFGLAKLKREAGSTALPAELSNPTDTISTPGEILGTLQYMAPEQLEGLDVDARADIFALGAVVYEMVTGKRTFAGQSRASVVAAILKEAPPPLGQSNSQVPAELDRIVGKMLAKDRNNRYASAADLLVDLRALHLV